MTVSEALREVTRLGIDTSPVVHFVERTPAYFPVCAAFFRAIDDNRVQAVAGTLTLTEALVKPLRENDYVLVAGFRELLSGNGPLGMAAVTVSVADRAGDLRARYRLGIADAVKVAACISAGCDAFLTGDKDLRRVVELTVSRRAAPSDALARLLSSSLGFREAKYLRAL